VTLVLLSPRDIMIFFLIDSAFYQNGCLESQLEVQLCGLFQFLLVRILFTLPGL
jgi:hypothetical protein